MIQIKHVTMMTNIISTDTDLSSAWYGFDDVRCNEYNHIQQAEAFTFPTLALDKRSTLRLWWGYTDENHKGGYACNALIWFCCYYMVILPFRPVISSVCKTRLWVYRRMIDWHLYWMIVNCLLLLLFIFGYSDLRIIITWYPHCFQQQNIHGTCMITICLMSTTVTGIKMSFMISVFLFASSTVRTSLWYGFQRYLQNLWFNHICFECQTLFRFIKSPWT